MKMPVTIYLNGKEYPLRDGESVLAALERQGEPMLSSCRNGVCQTCLMKAEKGAIPPKAQSGLKESLKTQGYFLSCVCHPEEDLSVSHPGGALDYQAEVIHSWDAGAAVRILRLSTPPGFQWYAGQFITVIRNDGAARSYSLASAPFDGYLELHVRRVSGGQLSNWLHDVLSPGDCLTIRGPLGDCLYTPGEDDAPLLLAGTGTGLAPLYGICRDALHQGHQGEIRLFHGSLQRNGLYHCKELEALEQNSQLQYHPCVLEDSEPIEEAVLRYLTDTEKTRAYLCGDPDIVNKMRKRLFLNGLSNRRIFFDPFVSAASTP